MFATMHIWDPEAYHKSSLTQQRWAHELLSKISIKGDERILDIGCGDGKVTAEISALVPRGSVVGIDNSASMISYAKGKYPESSWPNLDFELEDASDLQYDDEFDLVLSFACLHWVLDHGPVLEGIKRSLRHGGKALLQFGGKGNAASVLELVDDVMAEAKWASFFEDFKFPYGFFSAEDYTGWLNRAGLRTLRVEIVPKQMIQHGREGLAAWMRSTWLPYTERIPENLQKDFIYEVVDRYIGQHPLDSAGDVHVDMTRLEVEFEKI
jgi:trans-aconitate 2-methyltransferase